MYVHDIEYDTLKYKHKYVLLLIYIYIYIKHKGHEFETEQDMRHIGSHGWKKEKGEWCNYILILTTKEMV